MEPVRTEPGEHDPGSASAGAASPGVIEPDVGAVPAVATSGCGEPGAGPDDDEPPGAVRAGSAPAVAMVDGHRPDRSAVPKDAGPAAAQGPGDEPSAGVLATVFGDNADRARAYAALLAGDGVTRGVIGPREAGRLWTRHLLNSAVVAELLPASVSVVDVGSGAGLPGIPLGLARPDVTVTLVEPLQRRCEFLLDVLAHLELPNVRVLRGRAPDVAEQLGRPDVVVARALAPLDRLVGWCLPLLPAGGRLLAVRGARAGQEVEESAAAVRAAGGRDVTLVRCGSAVLDEPVTVVSMVRGEPPPPVRRPAVARPGRAGRGRRPGPAGRPT